MDMFWFVTGAVAGGSVCSMVVAMLFAGRRGEQS